jgi:hypothetical protein
MREACIRSVRNALGYEPSQAQLRNIEGRIQSAMLRGARENPEEWRALSEEQRLEEAGKRAAEELNVEAAKLEQRAEQTILAHDRIANYRASQVAQGRDQNGVEALERVLVHKYDEKSGEMLSIEERANANFNLAFSQMSDVFDMLNPGLWRRIVDTVVHGTPITRGQMRRAFTDALHGVTEGIPPQIRKAADLYHEAANALRQQFNAAGGIIGKLEDFGSPHSWSARQLERHGQARFVEDMLTWVNKRRYVHEDGRGYTDPELREFFAEAWKTVVSDGMTKDTSGLSGQGNPRAVKANRGSQHRVIHLRPEAAYEALSRYSEQNILEAMVGGLRRMSRDVALVETFGPNADAQFHAQLNAAMREAADIDATKAPDIRGRARSLSNLYDFLAGNEPMPESRRVSDFFGTLRNMQVWKLGSAAITSITDMEGMYKVALQNRLNPVQVMLNSTLAWAPKSRRYARRLGLVVETMVADLERLSGENLTSRTLSAKTASGVIRASGLSFTTNARRIGFSMTMMDSIGHLTRRYQDVGKLHENDYNILAAKGIDQQTWDIWRAARIDNWGANHTLLTPENIMRVEGVPLEARREAAIRLLSIVRSEQDLAIITPGARERVMMRTFFGNTESGSIGGEIARSMFVFKSFAITLQMRNWQRSGFFHEGKLGRYTYMAQMVITMALLGAIANWIKDLAAFKDPRPMWSDGSDPEMNSIVTRNWIQAGLSGGGLGVYGDFLFNESSPYSQNTAAETLAGPVLATAFGAANVTTGNIPAALAGEETDAGAEAVRFARGNLPFVNLPYTRGLADRAIFNELQDLIDPGAVDRLRERQEDRQGTQYWWDPSDNPLQGEGPERAPEMPN